MSASGIGATSSISCWKDSLERILVPGFPYWAKQTEQEGTGAVAHRESSSSSSGQESRHLPRAVRKRLGLSPFLPAPPSSKRQLPQHPAVIRHLNLLFPLCGFTQPALPLSLKHLFKEASVPFCCCSLQPYCPGASLHIYSLLSFCLLLFACLS